MKFEYTVELDLGYKPVLSNELVHEIRFTIEADNRVTADRMVKALFITDNVVACDGICIEE